MDMPNPFKLEQLTIKAVNEQGNEIPGVEPFTAMFNPAQYTITYRNRQTQQQTITPVSQQTQPAGQEPNRIGVKLLLDGTGVTGLDSMFSFFGALTTSVEDRIKKFLDLCYMVQEQLHRPHKLRVKWGVVNIIGFLESVGVNYTLFDQAGKPLRAELDAQFIAEEPQPAPVQLSSPDLTHVRQVRAGDTLPLMAKAMYGSSRYYLFVAEANELDDFRLLKPGMKLYFPPLDKDQQA